MSKEEMRAMTVADPCAAYTSVAPLWRRSRAACGGERFIKELDYSIDKLLFSNLLIPFSPRMTDEQYRFYRAEAEWPGITKQYARILVGGLLRKRPQLKLPDSVPSEAKDWLMDDIGRDGSSLAAFLDEAIWEEIQTSRAWVFVDYPVVENPDALTPEQTKALRPFPVVVKAENVINWRVAADKISGIQTLQSVIVRTYEEIVPEGEFHPKLTPTVWVHELNSEGNYQIRVFKREERASPEVINGARQLDVGTTGIFQYDRTITVQANGSPLTEIPAWPLNGRFDVAEPILTSIIDKEIALYNKMSRRNHLMYGAATYTPYIASDMEDAKFKAVVDSGLGAWFLIGQDDTAGVLETPTAALQDMDRAIEQTLGEMAKLGVRMLSPETAQSGVALELRNASQTAQLGSLNALVSTVLRDIICFMVNWRYDLDLHPSEFEFTMSEDFQPAPVGADWMRLITEWYENGLIPRTLWLSICKINDIVPPDYDDEEGKEEVNKEGVPSLRNTKPLTDSLDKM